jgi:Na+-driven multidrug efflux pump
VALSANTLMNYGLIFGNFGLPALGVEGAAIATVIARSIECFGLLLLVYWRRLPVAARPAELMSFDFVFLKRYLRTILPVVTSEVFWSLGFTTYNIVYARIGTEAIAAVNISITIENLAFVVFLSLANATAVLVGNRIGANQEELAFEYARRSLALTLLGAAVLGMALLFISPLVITVYKISATATLYALNILRVMAFTLWIRVLNLVLIIGVFRSGGDTRFALLLDAGMIWAIGVPLVLVGAFVWHLPVYYVYLLVVLEEFLKLIVGYLRFRTRAWINNLVQPA